MVSFAGQERFALHGLASAGRHGASTGVVGVRIEQVTDIAFASVIAKRDKGFMLINAVNTAFGIALPDGPRRATRGAVTFAGTGPGQWLASAQGDDATGFVTRLRGRISPFAAVSDQSDSRLVLRLSGERVRDALMKGVSIDLHPKAFKVGDVASTQVAYIGVQLDMLDDAPTYLLTGPRSMARTLWSWLSASAAEFGYEVATR
jgi:heterotetrameric sarcosine oxidase gamma subunit